jgi:hypothetical protein
MTIHRVISIAPSGNPFGFIAERKKAEQQREAAPAAPAVQQAPDSSAARLLKVRAKIAKLNAELDDLESAARDVPSQTLPQGDLAQQIIRAGQIRRGEIPAAQEMSEVAKAIVAAGRKRRGETI